MDQKDILERSKAVKESGEFIKSDFWTEYTRRLANKLKMKQSDCINLEDGKLSRAQGAAQVLQWALFELPKDVLRDMGKPSESSEPPE
jgi:hypothetical protein